MQKFSRLWENVGFRKERLQEGTQELSGVVDSDEDQSQELKPPKPPRPQPQQPQQLIVDRYDSGGDSDDGDAEISLEGDDPAAEPWETRDRRPLLVREVAESDTSGDIELDEDEGADGGGGFQQQQPSQFDAGVFNPGFVVDDEEENYADEEASDLEGLPGGGGFGGGGGDDDEEEREEGDGEEAGTEEEFGDEGEEAEETEEEEDEEEFEDDEDDDGEDGSSDCYSLGRGLPDGGVEASLRGAPTPRPKPKIIGHLIAEMTFDQKGPGVNVKIMEVELALALTKLRRKSNKKMRWSQMQVCLTLLPEKVAKFRTPMVDHEDPKKKDLLPLEGGAAGGGDKAGGAADGDATADKAAAAAGEEDKKKKKKDSKKKDHQKKKTDGTAAATGKIGKLDLSKLKVKSKKEAAADADNSKKAGMSTNAAKKASKQQQQQERQQLREQQREQRLQRRQQDLQEQKRKLAAAKALDEPKKDVTLFSGTKEDPNAPASVAPVAEIKKLGMKSDADKQEKDVYRFVPIYLYQLRKNAHPALAIRFRVYGCWREKRSYLLGENTFALERMEEAMQSKQNRFRLVLEERRFEVSKLKHLSDSEDEERRQKMAAKAQKKLARDFVDARLPPPTEGPMLVNQPELFLGLSYNQLNGHLQVEVVKACNLSNPKSERAPTAYVKVHLLWGPFPEKRSVGRVLFKSRTLAIPECRNPAWHETFEFPVSKSHLNDVSVMVKAYCKHTLSRTVTIGWCSVGRNNCSEEALDHWSDMREAAGEQICNWHVLLKVGKEKTESQLDSD